MQVDLLPIRADLRITASRLVAASIFNVRTGHLRRKAVFVGWGKVRVSGELHGAAGLKPTIQKYYNINLFSSAL